LVVATLVQNAVVTTTFLACWLKQLNLRQVRLCNLGLVLKEATTEFCRLVAAVAVASSPELVVESAWGSI
jgi:hypothetical protein